MSAFSKIMTSVAGVAAVTAMAAPAAAQNYPYGGNSSGGVVGAIINSVIGGGYGQYPQGNYGYGQANQRTLVSQCAAATEQRLNAAYRGQGYGGQNGYNGYNGYQNGYGYQQGYASQGGARVVGITSVERRSNGGLKVRGLATSSAYAGQYGNQGYSGQYGGQYGNQGYGGQYGGQYGNQGYQNGYGANAQADISFSCKVDAQGRVNSVNLQRNQNAYNRGY